MATNLPGIQPTPERYPALGAVARALQAVDKFGRAPFGYSNPPVEILSNLLSVPQLARTLENVAYGSPLTRGTGQARVMTPDTRGAVEAALNLTPAAPTLSRVAIKGARAAAPYAARHAVELADKYGVSPTMNIIKPKGGNWISGSVEEAIKPLKRHQNPEQAIAYANERLAQSIPGHEYQRLTESLPEWQRESAINKWLDTKLSKYIRNEMGTPEDPLRLAIEDWPARREPLLAEKQAQIDKAVADMERARAERGFTPEMMTQSQARIRELQKEKRILEGRTGIHMTENELQDHWVPEELLSRRAASGYPREGLSYEKHAAEGFPESRDASSRMATSWENFTDEAIHNMPAGDRLSHEAAGTAAAIANRASSPWLAKVPPETMTYGVYPVEVRHYLEFQHIIDELRNAMNPRSGLPRELQLDPSKLDKITVPQASDLVDRINAWRAAQQFEVNAARAGNAATVLHKDYPEQGLKWVELKSTGNLGVPEGYTVEPNSTYLGKTGYQLRRLNGDRIGIPQPTEEAAFAQLNAPEFKTDKALEDALKYEGEQLKHCVGGYCPDVLEGRSRIFSLRDTEGRPHVTIEVAPQPRNIGQQDIPDRYIDRALDELGLHSPEDQFGREEDIDKLAGDLWRKDNPDTQRIVQIKGLSNRAPAEQYLPFVQDFVRSQPWSDVGDIQNTGLYKIDKDFLGDLSNFTPSTEDLRGLGRQERMQLLSDAIDKGYLPERGFVSRDEWEESLRKLMNERKPNFAEGGPVDAGWLDDGSTPPDQAGVNHMVDMQQGGVPGYAGGGLVGLESKYGLAPYGLRHAGDSAKGLGYFGAIPGREGHMTEVSSEDDLGEYPLLVPGLTGEEIRHLAEGKEPTDEIYRKAGAHADKRRAAGRSTFIEQGELRHPKPEFASGGFVEYNPAEIENAVTRLREDMHA